MNTYTAFCQSADGRGTIWITTLKSDSVEEALKQAREECASDWECEEEDVHVLGLAEGDVTILHWEDIDD